MFEINKPLIPISRKQYKIKQTCKLWLGWKNCHNIFVNVKGKCLCNPVAQLSLHWMNLRDNFRHSCEGHTRHEPTSGPTGFNFLTEQYVDWDAYNYAAEWWIDYNNYIQIEREQKYPILAQLIRKVSKSLGN